jgi:hypothetical protein
MDEATIEDLDITTRSSRESDAKKAEDGDVVLSTTLLKEPRYKQTREQSSEQKRLELTCGVQRCREER